jgi:hypothetical protein
VELERREALARELQRAGDSLEAALCRVGAYLAWVHRDLKVFQTELAALRARLGRESNDPRGGAA